MSLFNLTDNPLFLQNWRERMRSSSLISALTIVIIVCILILVNSTLNKHFVYNNIYEAGKYSSERIEISWQQKALLDLSVVQGIVILFFGTISAYKMAARERSSGTLDFHRASPTPRNNQILGLLLGSSSLEWGLYFLIFFTEVLVSLFNSQYLLSVLRFNMSLIISTLFFHSLAVFIGISSNPKKSKGSAVSFVFGLYIIIHLLAINNLSFLHHLTWLPAYDILNTSLKGFSQGYRYYLSNSHELLYMFYGFDISSLLFQFLVNAPLIGILLSAVSRKISRYDHPFLTKGQTLLCIFYILFLFTGSIYTVVLEGSTRHWGMAYYLNASFNLIVLLGMAGVMIVTPSQLLFLKGHRKSQKLSINNLQSGDDPSSNVAWQLSFSLIISIIFGLYSFLFDINFLMSVIYVAILLSYCVFFANFIEFFRFSPFHNKKGYFWTTLIILWIIIPVTGAICKPLIKSSEFIRYFLVTSPFFGGLYSLAEGITEKLIVPNGTILATLIVNALLAGLAFLMAYHQRQVILIKALR